jgi:hypothetical protein
LEGGPPIFRQDCTCPALLEDRGAGVPYGAVTRSGPPFQALPVPYTTATGLVRVRSPLLTESPGRRSRNGRVLMSFPPATEMFQFAGFASQAYGLSLGYRLRGGLPHSETPGSPIARISPGLFAACCVLHRLSVPRHPPDALLVLLSPRPAANPRPKPAAPRARLSHEDTSGTVARPRRSLATLASPFHQHPAPPSAGQALNPLPSPGGTGSAGGAAGGGDRVRTDALLLAKQALSRLSYTPFPGPGARDQAPGETLLIPGAWRLMVGQGGFEPPTSRLSSARSNRLSY